MGVAKNDRLNALTAEAQRLAAETFEHTGEKVRRFTDIHYGARTWDRPRRVISKLEHTRGGANPGYVVTSLEGDAQALYDRLYCARGDMENRIKEQQLDLFADRTSCHHWWANQFRLLLASLAYTLIETIRHVGPQGHRTGPRLRGHDPIEAVQDRRGDPHQYPPGEVPARQHLSVPEPLLPGGATVGRRIAASRLVSVGVARSRHGKVRPIAGKTIELSNITPSLAAQRTAAAPPPLSEPN